MTGGAAAVGLDTAAKTSLSCVQVSHICCSICAWVCVVFSSSSYHTGTSSRPARPPVATTATADTATGDTAAGTGQKDEPTADTPADAKA